MVGSERLNAFIKEGLVPRKIEISNMKEETRNSFVKCHQGELKSHTNQNTISIN